MARTRFTETASTLIGTDSGLFQYSFTKLERLNIPVTVQGAAYSDLSLYQINVRSYEASGVPGAASTAPRPRTSRAMEIVDDNINDNQFDIRFDIPALIAASSAVDEVDRDLSLTPPELGVPAQGTRAATKAPAPRDPTYFYITIELRRIAEVDDARTLELGRGYIEVIWSPLTTAEPDLALNFDAA